MTDNINPTSPTTIETAPVPLPPLSRPVVALLVLATIGSGIATIVPMAFTLAFKLNQIAPGREELLGYILGASAVSSLISTPLTGILSDRTRTRWGRRRPYTLGGIALGLAALPLLILAQDPVTLAAGWIVMSLGFGTAAGSIGNFQADRLPRAQRGRVSGLTGMAMQVSPVLGILLAGTVAGDVAGVFLLPAAVGVVCMLAFVVFVHEPDSRGMIHDAPLSLTHVIRSFGFRPSNAPDFAWNWLGRFVLFFGLALTTSFSTFFYAQRLGIPVAEVVTILALTSTTSIVSAIIGALGAGFISDRIGRRRPLIILSVVFFASGSCVSAFAWSLPIVLMGTFITSLGTASFLAVNQALTLDVLPNRGIEAGRFMAIAMFSQKIPTAIAPLVAPALLAIGVASDVKNYGAIYIAAGALALTGGLIIAAKVRGVR